MSSYLRSLVSIFFVKTFHYLYSGWLVNLLIKKDKYALFKWNSFVPTYVRKTMECNGCGAFTKT